MFEALKNKRRDALKVGTAWFLFGAIIVVFIFWGTSPHHEGFGQGGIAAYVNGEGIPTRSVNRMVENMRQGESGEGDADEAGRKQRQQMALGQLVTQELIAQNAAKSGIAVSDAEVRDYLVKQPAFQENWQFKRDYYLRYLQISGQTAGELENAIRREILMQRIQRDFASALKPTELESKKQAALADMKADLDYVTIPVSGGDPNAVSAADAREFAKKEEAKVKAYFESHQAEFAQPEQAHARHILVKFDAKNSDSVAAALEKAKAIKARLAKGEDFAKIAKAESDDPGSKDKGGDLGFFGRGRMVPEFETAAFSSPLKKVTDPIKSEYGYHLIEPLEKRPAKQAEFNEATKETIAKRLISERRSTESLAKFEELAKKGDLAGVDVLAKQNGFKWETTGPFSIDSSAIPKLGANDEMIRAAFRLTADKPLAATVFHQGPNAYVLRYKAPPAKSTAAAADSKAKNKPAIAGMPDFDNPAIMQELMATQKTREVMGSWLRGLEKGAKVEYAPKVAGGGGEQ